MYFQYVAAVCLCRTWCTRCWCTTSDSTSERLRT